MSIIMNIGFPPLQFNFSAVPPPPDTDAILSPPTSPKSSLSRTVPVPLTAQGKYAVGVAPTGATRALWLWETNTNPYPGGDRIAFGDARVGNDLAFETYVELGVSPVLVVWLSRGVGGVLRGLLK